MNTDIALYWVQQALQTSALICAPLLGVALVVGLIVSIVQAITSIQEATLSYIPKMLAVAVVLLLLSPWMIQMLADFTTHVFAFIPNISK